MSQAQTAVVVGPGEGRTIEGPAGGPLAFKVRGDQTAGALTALENTIAPGDGPPLHVHANEDEAWWIVEGTLRFRLEDELSECVSASLRLPGRDRLSRLSSSRGGSRQARAASGRQPSVCPGGCGGRRIHRGKPAGAPLRLLCGSRASTP